MIIRVFESVVAESVAVLTHQVRDGTSIVFLTPSVLNPVTCARFCDIHDITHQVPANQILSIDPDLADLRLPVRYVDPETGKEVAALRERVDRLEVANIRLGPGPETQEQVDRRTAQFVEDLKIVGETPAPNTPVLCTTDGRSVAEARASQTNETGQHPSYIVLCSDERAKGFVRPYRDAYKHVGVRPKYPLVELTAEQHERYDQFSYVKFEAYPPDSPESNGGSLTGRYWTRKDLDSGCGAVTTMGRSLSETYARDPKFYGATFCVGCNKHLPVAEFIWTADGAVVGS